jgi:tRNA A-37 threonylcarbamoyl transferase component Bud32
VGVDYVRYCPTCGADNAPEVMRCACGAMLFGVDLVRKTATADRIPDEKVLTGAASLICLHEDCAQTNPPGSRVCLYCNRPLETEPALGSAVFGLINLPAALLDRYRVVRTFPAQGAEAEILLVEAMTGGPARVAKIFRHGIRPRASVQERIERIDVRHRVALLESGISDGHAYELMEFCAFGSLRERMACGPIATADLGDIVRQVAARLVAVHAAGLLHRDLKPDNVLVRNEQPLELVLADFGIASVIDATQRFTSAARTLPYAAPESLSGVIDGKSDYWSLGMLLLEAAMGRHPFAGLSEAVMLHHLATRSINLDAITDANLRKLLRGLLLRDPGQRWGADEIARWLGKDPGLVEPVEYGPGASFANPYHLGNEICHTREQLAIALARNWRAGLADIHNGQLLAWFRDEMKDQNTVRLLLELQHERGLHGDVQLLKLMLHLAPGLPPVWRGESIELAAILGRANQALQGDSDAARWLDAIYQHRVLAAYVEAGNSEAAELVKRWDSAIERFRQAWLDQAALIKSRSSQGERNGVANFDQLMYGEDIFQSPPLSVWHPGLLAISHDDEWTERLRRRLQALFVELLVQCPWLAALGKVHQMDGAGLLVLEALLPHIRATAQRQVDVDARQREAADEELRRAQVELAGVLARLGERAKEAGLQSASRDFLQSVLDEYFDLLARFRGSGRSDALWMDLRKLAGRRESLTKRMQKVLDELALRRTANAGWFSPRMLTFMTVALVLGPILLGEGSAMFLFSGFAGVMAWRFLPMLVLTRQLRGLADLL